MTAVEVLAYKLAVFGDIDEDIPVGHDLAADRARSAAFRDHEMKHVVGGSGPGFIAFPDAAAHAGLALHLYRNPGKSFLSRLPREASTSIGQYLGAKEVPASWGGAPHLTHHFEIPGGVLALAQRPRTNRAISLFTRPGLNGTNQSTDRPILIPSSLAAFGRLLAQQNIRDPSAYRKLLGIVPDPSVLAKIAPATGKIKAPGAFAPLIRR